MAPSAPKPIVTSWDVFDTLMSRFNPNPQAIFEIVEARQGKPGFAARRLEAQAALDKIGEPYVLQAIYRHMVDRGMTRDEAASLLRAEIAAERFQLMPIRRNVVRVEPADLIISDMYLPQELISALLFDTCDLSMHRPIIRSNWGKHTGSIWPLVQGAYVVRRHVGDNPGADGSVPSRFGIPCELVQDAQLSDWEKTLQELHLPRLALVQREVRLRCTPPRPTPFHQAVVGPYLTLLFCYALYLPHRFGIDAEFAFLSRSSDELARVFAALYPAIPARTLDLSRRLSGNEQFDQLFSGMITPATVLVDMVSSGRSFLRFAERNGEPGRTLSVLTFLDLLLQEPERHRAEERIANGRFHYVMRLTGEGRAHWNFEHLLQMSYPPVAAVVLDPRSGGLVRSYAHDDLTAAEAALVGWKSGVVTELVRTLQRRELADQPGVIAGDMAERVVHAISRALRAILAETEIMREFTSFRARENMDWA